MSFGSSYSVYSNDSTSIRKGTVSQEWQLISVIDNKIVVSRPLVRDFEKRNSANEDKNITVTMDGGKKRGEKQNLNNNITSILKRRNKAKAQQDRA